MTTPLDTTAPPTFWGRDGAGDGYRAATVCRRGHEPSNGNEAYPAGDLGFCAKCGSGVLSGCLHCGKRIRGVSREITLGTRRPVTYAKHEFGFCDGCGEPYPWPTRQDLVYQLLNLLDEEGISERDRMAVTESLQELLDPLDGDDAKAENRAAAAVKKWAPGLLTGVGYPILSRLITDGLLH
jgi:hypothetical protein